MNQLLQTKRAGACKDGSKPEKPQDKLRNWGILGKEERTALLGNASDTRESRNRWIDAVERSMEEDGFEKGQKHLRRNFSGVRNDGDYGLEEKKEEELLLMEVR